MIAGKTMLQHVFEQAGRARYLTELVVATDDQRIFDEARRFGAPVRMTRADHPSGTDRAAEVASAVAADIVVNIQGDEPLIDPDSIDAAILGLRDDRGIPMATLKKRIEHPREVTDPNVVKVVTDRNQNAIYFSRSPIPFVRADRPEALSPLQAHRAVCLPPRISVTISGIAGWAFGAGGAVGAIARDRKRPPDSGGGNRV